jgi:hypothetical protein
MASALDIIRAVRPPRAAFLDFPLGHTTGKPHDSGLQREILIQALDAFKRLTQPGSIATLDFHWSETDEWKQKAMREGDTRTPRHDTPQYQTEEDRTRAEVNNTENTETQK